jgi:predicted RND superfamily exporter protein
MSDDRAAGHSKFRAIVQWPVVHPWLTLLITVVVAIAAALSTSRLRTNGSLAAMFPEHDPAADALVRVLDDFPAADQLLVLASLPASTPGAAPEKLTSFGQRFVEAVDHTPDVKTLTDGVFYQPDADSRAFVEKVIGPAAMYYLDDAAFEAARHRLSRDEIRKQIAQDKAILSAPGPAADALSKIMRADPLRLHEFLMARLASQKPFRTYQNGDAFISPDGRSLLIRVIGRQPPNDLEFCKALMTGVTRLAESVNRDGLSLEYAGSYAIATRSERSIRRDMIESVIGSVVLLQLLFLVAYRSPFKLFALAFGPVALGILLGFGVYGFVSPGLTPFTAVLGAILAGMGIDYSIQYLAYYETRRTQGGSRVEAAAQTAIDMSPAVLAAWATSVVGFVAIGWSRVAALRDFALLGTLGLTGAFLCAVIVLPALLVLTDRRPTPAPRSRLRFGTGALLQYIAAHRRLFLGLSFAALMTSAVVFVHSKGDVLPLESDLTVMHPRPNPAIDAQYHVTDRFGVSPGSLVVYLKATDAVHLVTLACEVSSRLETTAARAGGVSGTYGLATLLPDPRTVPVRSAAISPGEADRVVGDFNAALAENDFAPEAFDEYARFLHLLLTQTSAPTVKDLLPYRRMAETLLPASATHGVEPTEAITLVFVRQPLDQNRADRDAAINVVRQSLAGLDGATVTGLGVVSHDAEQAVRSELPRLILAAVLIVAVYLALHFRNLADASLSLLPAIFGIAVAAGVLRIAGQKLNMVNLVSVPLLIGIDVDYGIFLVNLIRLKRAKECSQAELVARMDPVVHAVIICATATILGYISLVWTSVPAEHSLGIAAAAGVGTCLLGVLFLLVPLFFSLARRR